MAKSYGGISVDISGNYDNRDIQKAIRDLRALDTSAATSQKAFGGFDGVARMAGAAIAGMAAAAGALAIKLGVEGVQAAIADQRAKEGLAKTLDNLNLSHETSAVEAYIDALQRSSGVADDVLRPAYDRLIRSIGDTDTAQKALQLTLDIAAGTGRDAQQVAMALGRAYDGSTTALGRLGAGIDASILKTKDMDLITKRLSDTFGGQANVAASTYEGRINRLTVAADELKEAFGYGLLSNMDSVFNQTGSATRAMQGLEGIVSDAGEQIGYMVSGLNVLINRLGELTSDTTSVEEEQENLLVTLTKIGYLLNPITAGFVLFGDSLTNAGKDAETLADGINTARDSVIDLLLAQRASEQTGRQVAATAYDSGIARLAEARHTARLTEILGHVPGEYEEVEKKARGAASGTRELTKAEEELKAKLEEKRNVLKTAIEEANEYAKNIRKSFIDSLDLSAALDKAKESGTSIVDEFVKQGERMRAFTDNLRRLVAAGLDRSAFDAIIAKGAERGADIASALADGNIRENVRRVNDVYRSVASMGEQVGAQATPVFMTAGITTAQAMITSMIREFMPAGRKRRELLSNIDEMVREALANLARVSGVSVAGPAITGGVASIEESPQLLPPIEIPVPNYSTMQFYEGYNLAPSNPQAFSTMQFYPGYAFANGGIVTAPTMGLVGEAGPEAIIPLNRTNGIGTTINLTINAGMGADGAEVGRQIVDALKQYQRRNGPVPITVA